MQRYTLFREKTTRYPIFCQNCFRITKKMRKFAPQNQLETHLVRMKRWILATLLVLCLTVFANWQTQNNLSQQIAPPRTESSILTPQRQQPHEATLTDATQLYRICSSRPQRILPTQGSRTERTTTPPILLARQHHVKPLHSYYDSRRRLESAPYCLSASCDYYVIALRHIIR